MSDFFEFLKKIGSFRELEAIEFPRNVPWINVIEPLTLDKLKGHVILLDFWTYCCINCIHILNDLKWLEEKYKDEPFVVIGVHSAKFQNEKDVRNIKSAVIRYEIHHPVIVDNDMNLWTAYGIHSWPSFILIGPDGKVILNTAGEGKRHLLDKQISKALYEGKEKGLISEKKVEILPDITLESLLKFPGKIDIDIVNKHLFISDSNHNRILQIKLNSADKGNILAIIGSGDVGLKDGSFKKATFNKPQGIVYQDKKLYVADTENHVIREIDLENKRVKTIAGSGEQGYTYRYHGKPKEVSLSSPWDLAIGGNYLYIAMAGIHQIWRMDLKKNIIENFAGSGRENIIDGQLIDSALAQPSGLAIDNKRLYFADSEVSGIRYVDFETNQIKSYMGKGLFVFGLKDGKFNNALLQHPLGIDVKGNKIYIADTYNHAIREANLENKEIKTLIYSPNKGTCKVGDKICNVLPLYEPNDVLFYEDNLYIADTNNHLIRVFDLKNMELKDFSITLEP
jgi:thiol-disulfide isomerase/thioredoxin/sugar lactone lactonase YvrE